MADYGMLGVYSDVVVAVVMKGWITVKVNVKFFPF